MKTPSIIFAFVVLCIFSATAQIEKSRTSIQNDSITVLKTVNEFLTVFKNLEWDKFSTYFDEHATAFFPPSANVADRTNNKSETLKVFKNVFDNARKQKTGPPYLTIDPQNIHVQLLSSVAVVTFQLVDPGMFGRRTLVFSKQKNEWKIIHLHASGIPQP